MLALPAAISLARPEVGLCWSTRLADTLENAPGRQAGAREALLRPIRLFSLAIGALVAAVAGCGGQGTNTVVSTVSPPTALTVSAAPTHVPELDHLIDAALQGNTIEMAALTGYQSVPCTRSDASTPGAPPRCRDNEPDGARVDVLPSTGCDFAWVRPEQVPDTYQSLLGAMPQFDGAFVPKPALFSFGAAYVIVLRTGTRSDGSPSGVALYVKGGRIVRTQTECGSFHELIDEGLVDSYIVAPSP
jgi:hypothetical protein